jgi:hypothetical protein
MPASRVSRSLGDLYRALNQEVKIHVNVMIGQVRLKWTVDLVGFLM